MQATTWAGSGQFSEMQFSKRASSDGRSWTGFEAVTYDVSGGIAERPPFTAHTLVMHLSAPVMGSCRCDGPALRRVMRPGDMDFVPVGYPATWRDDAPGSVLNVKLSASLVRSTAETMRLAGRDAVCLRPQLHLEDAKLEHLGWALVAELESGDQHDRLFAESVSNAIAVHLVRRYSETRPVETTHGLSRRQFRLVVDYMNEHITASLSLAELAAVAGLSPSHFNSLFKQSAGVTAHQYVIRRRVDRAVNLLSRDGARLIDVADQAGFADQSHMSRCMRRVVGMTPAAVLRQYR
jgi:AraC family transcriptional regulator